MAHTYETVLAHFGEFAQIAGGTIIVNHEGKNVEVGSVDNASGLFALTEKGQALLEAPKAEAEPAKPAKGKAAKDILGAIDE